ncbi:MAG: ribosome-associated translation inhibitor RaiA [Bryobacteraceae bacterium]
MKVSYKGVHHDLPEKLQEKLDAKFAKLSKMLEHNGEKKAHVILTHERHLHHAEITLQFHDHKLVAVGSDADIFNAMSGAIIKLEKQAVKHSARFRDMGRRDGKAKSKETKTATVSGRATPSAKKVVAAKTASASTPANGRRARIFRVSDHERNKPITVEEAVIHMEDGRDYIVYRDAESEGVSVLVRRKDGHFDLVEV